MIIFSIFRYFSIFFLHPQIPDFLILSDHNKPYINGSILDSCINLNFEKLTLKTGFVVQGHTHTHMHVYIYIYIYIYILGVKRIVVDQ